MNNIRDCEDAFERYKMPELSLRFKHQGQYNSTFITNITELSKSLHISIDAIVKFFGNALNTQCKIINGELSLKGNFTKNTLKETLREFINLYILCKNCNLPELEYISKRKYLAVRCKSCGSSFDADLDDRVYKTLFCPPKRQRKAKIEHFVFEETPNEVEWSIDTSEEAALKRKQEALGDSELLQEKFV